LNVAAGGFSRRLAGSLQTRQESDDPLHLLLKLAEIVDRTDTYMSGHSVRVGELTASLARLVGSSHEEIEFARRVGLLHDIGKAGVPEKVLRKHGPLNPEELHLVRLHPILGASLVSRVTGNDRMVPAILHHHERWDGAGYPVGLGTTDIPQEARMIAVADAYDAMTSYRTYGEPLGTEEALSELRASSGSQFEPLLVDAIHDAFTYGLLGNKSTQKLTSLG
jgi:putative nucleotidyltransferase with HDIG domain